MDIVQIKINNYQW